MTLRVCDDWYRVIVEVTVVRIGESGWQLSQCCHRRNSIRGKSSWEFAKHPREFREGASKYSLPISSVGRSGNVEEGEKKRGGSVGTCQGQLEP